MVASMSNSDAMSADQRELAAYGRELFSRIARLHSRVEAGEYGEFPLQDGAVLVAELFRGGGRIFVASDRTVLFVSSALGSEEARAEFEGGRRTPLEAFGSD